MTLRYTSFQINAKELGPSSTGVQELASSTKWVVTKAESALSQRLMLVTPRNGPGGSQGAYSLETGTDPSSLLWSETAGRVGQKPVPLPHDAGLTVSHLALLQLQKAWHPSAFGKADSSLSAQIWPHLLVSTTYYSVLGSFSLIKQKC